MVLSLGEVQVTRKDPRLENDEDNIAGKGLERNCSQHEEFLSFIGRLRMEYEKYDDG